MSTNDNVIEQEIADAKDVVSEDCVNCKEDCQHCTTHFILNM